MQYAKISQKTAIISNTPVFLSFFIRVDYLVEMIQEGSGSSVLLLMQHRPFVQNPYI